jgi:hypothetical protein
MPQPLYHQGKSPWYSLDRRLGGLQSQSGCGGEEKNSQSLLGLKPPIIQFLAQCYTIELSWLLFMELQIEFKDSRNCFINSFHKFSVLHGNFYLFQYMVGKPHTHTNLF